MKVIFIQKKKIDKKFDDDKNFIPQTLQNTKNKKIIKIIKIIKIKKE